MDQKPLVELVGLKKYFNTPRGKLHAVDNISLSIMPGETMGLVGESGCGKSTVGNVVIRLLDPTDGVVKFRGENIFGVSKEKSFELRRKMQIVFQDPYSSLNPKKTVKSILSEPYQIHKLVSSKSELDRKISELIEMTGIEPYVLEKYPHELDGGRRQLVGIARALSLDPEFIVCDEPVSSLDVSIQATIINLLMDMQKIKKMSYLFISHDLSVVSHISDSIAVMYLGQIVESATTKEIFENPKHPYTIALLSAIPKIDTSGLANRIVLKGDVTSPIEPKVGCRFASRCWMAHEKCASENPVMRDIGNGHCVACHYYEQSQEQLRAYQKAN